LVGGWTKGGEAGEGVRGVVSKSESVPNTQPLVMEEVMGVFGTLATIASFPVNIKSKKIKN